MGFQNKIEKFFRKARSILCVYRTILSIVGLLFLDTLSFAQDSSDPSAAQEKVRNVLDDHPIPSARGDSLSGAMITSADDLDATQYNPAGIGGLQWGKQKIPWIRKFYFPWAAASANQNSVDLSQDFNTAGGNNDRVIGKSILAAHAGKRQYARANILTGLVFGRILLVPINDVQIAATPQTDDLETTDVNESELINAHLRSQSGGGAGFSAQSPDGNLSIGYFGYSVQRTDIEGNFDYDDMLDTSRRSQVLKEAQVKSSGSGHHVGIIWQLGKAWSPTLGINIKDIGDTHFISKTAGAANQRIKQNNSVGFSVGPNFKSGGGLKLTLQADRLNDPDVALAKKYRLGTEISIGGFGSHSTLALRAGLSQAGGSGGIALNLGLIGFNAGVYSVDIGDGNQRVIETRGVADIYVNVAEF